MYEELDYFAGLKVFHPRSLAPSLAFFFGINLASSRLDACGRLGKFQSVDRWAQLENDPKGSESIEVCFFNCGGDDQRV